MKVVNVAEAKNNLSALLEQVRRGSRIRIMNRGTPVADLVPVEITKGSEDEAFLADLERRGIIRRGKGGPIPKELLKPTISDPKGETLKALLEERRNGR
ncbi:MAG: type II toxin-antitoxin system Phd/YefM family antitoxin [Planctomycetes bacterium]|nr:type II toxin-antitoxin system Phd/YefM family antitoxin [Planctomycetota bacterium]